MKRLIPFLTGMALIQSACSTLPTRTPPPSPRVPVNPGGAVGETADVTDPRKPMEVKAGEAFSIVLESNISTGYHWELIGKLDKEVVQFVSQDYQAAEPVLPGSGGVEVWAFKAIAAGETAITLGYYPPANEPAEPAQTMTFIIKVK